MGETYTGQKTTSLAGAGKKLMGVKDKIELSQYEKTMRERKRLGRQYRSASGRDDAATDSLNKASGY